MTKKGITPARERAEIGTPAGESPDRGRERHGTYGLTPEIDVEEIRRRGYIESEYDLDEEEFRENGDEISVTGGLTGTKVKGGIPAGGAQAGGTAGKPQEYESGEEKS